MADIDLKEYTTRAKELESAIYTQKRLMASQGTIIKNQLADESVSEVYELIALQSFR